MSEPRGQAKGRGRELVRLAGVSALVLVAVAVLATEREVSIGRAEVAEFEAAIARSAWPEAIAHARLAAEARIPGSPWPERALRRLDVIGKDAEARRDLRPALLAYGAMRTAALAAPSSTSAYWLATADDGLARLALFPR